MAQTAYLSDREEKLVIKSLKTQMMIEYDKGNEEMGREMDELIEKLIS